ncbi:SRPBCC family protein [Streptomyces sp. NPDC058295]|jgi:aromatase|uniref:aromatase/cyclase n=1 Tax=Streptomyces sp. NPDC058295 TaxID=3346431 RepID=UPI0036EC499D
MPIDSTTRHSAEHTARYAGPALRGYGLIADVTRWPVLFPPCLAGEVLESDRDSERIRLWAVVGSGIRTWTSLRKLDEDRLRIDFRQETPGPPLEWMSGHWAFEGSADDTRLVLGHEWVLAAGAEDTGATVAEALDRNSEAEVEAVVRWAGHPEGLEELLFTVRDAYVVRAPLPQVYDFLYRADLWPSRVPHVVALDLQEDSEVLVGGAHVQTLDMRTRSDDGSVHGTQSIRLCFPDERIVYKQTTVPRGLLGHSGAWLLSEAGDETHVTAVHQAAVDPAALEEVFGPGVTLAAARDRAAALLAGNSRRTLERCGTHLAAEAAR